jgi:hypothetical protein
MGAKLRACLTDSFYCLSPLFSLYDWFKYLGTTYSATLPAGTHISFVRSVNLDSWTPEQVEVSLASEHGSLSTTQASKQASDNALLLS